MRRLPTPCQVPGCGGQVIYQGDQDGHHELRCLLCDRSDVEPEQPLPLSQISHQNPLPWTRARTAAAWAVA